MKDPLTRECVTWSSHSGREGISSSEAGEGERAVRDPGGGATPLNKKLENKTLPAGSMIDPIILSGHGGWIGPKCKQAGRQTQVKARTETKQ